MKKMMFIAAIALCAMSCGNKKAANTEAAAEEAQVVEEVAVVDTTAAVADTTVEVVEEAAVETVAE